MFNRLTSRSIPLIVLGVLALGAAFVMAWRGIARGLRVVAAVGVGALVWAWAIAQYPYLLPFRLTIAQGAGSPTTMKWLLGWFIVVLVTVIPMLIVLFTLDQRGHLGEDPGTSRLAAPGVGEVAAGSAAAAGAESTARTRDADSDRDAAQPPDATERRDAAQSRDTASRPDDEQRRNGRHRAQPPRGDSDEQG